MMNPRGDYGGYRYGGYNPIRGRQPVSSTSQNLQSTFQPKTEWKEEDAALVLLLHLPGFVKEQVRILTDESRSYLIVYGERMLEINIRSRFNTGYNIPKNWDLSRMKSELAGGILTIRIPKIIPAVQRASPRELEATTSQESPGAQDTTTTGQLKPEKKVEEETPPGEETDAPSSQKATSKSISQKGQDGSSQKTNVLDNTTKQIDEKAAGHDGEKVDQNVTEKKEKNEAYGKPIEEEKPEKVVEREEEKNGKIEESKVAETGVIKKKEEEEKNEAAAGGDKDMSNKDTSRESKESKKAESVVLKKKEEEGKNEAAAGGDKAKSNKDISQESKESKIDQSVVLKKEEEEKEEAAAGGDKDESNKDISQESKESKIAESVGLKNGEEEKKEAAAGGDKDKSNKDISQESEDMEHASASANKSDKDVGMVDDKYRLVLNICVGVLVIVALGAHFYSLISSSRRT
ncbi:unnamed protein product [Dovyalis caffra]|uniref:SHSP domain-containing protein n=1 Tax=Dovyalis caffra TaxID=77055 RepID=A0AAV1QTP4_9ROSI|nr:unnamed protein product [Dovyalis caffra]